MKEKLTEIVQKLRGASWQYSHSKEKEKREYPYIFYEANRNTGCQNKYKKKWGERKGVAKHRHVMHQAYEEISYLDKSTYAFLMDSESFYYFCIKK